MFLLHKVKQKKNIYEGQKRQRFPKTIIYQILKMKKLKYISG